MLTVENNVVQFREASPEGMLDDVRCVVSAFIKHCKVTGMSDELVEKTCICMIAEGFEMLDKNRIFKLKNDTNKKEEE